jgi:hypothetical protein
MRWKDITWLLTLLFSALFTNITKSENQHPLDLLDTYQPYDIKVGGPGFNCQVKLNKVEQRICDSWILSYVDRHFSEEYQRTLFRAKELHPVTQQFRQNQRDWLKLRNRCEDDGCIGQAYIDKLCYWQSHRLDQSALKVLSTEVEIARRKQLIKSKLFDQHLVFNTRIRYLCNKLDSSWSTFLPLILPYQAKKVIKNIKFTASNLSKKKADRALCDDFVTLLNNHQDHNSLACGLPDFPPESDFSLPTTRAMTKAEYDHYDKNFSTMLIRQYNLLEVGAWPAYYQHGIQPDSINNNNVVVVKKPYLNACLWDETGHGAQTYLWSTLTNSFSTRTSNLEELTRIGSTTRNYFYKSLAMEGMPTNLFRPASDSQLFIYKGETFASFKNRQVTRFPPQANGYVLCNIDTQISFIKQ